MPSEPRPVAIIAAVAKNGVIGRGNALPWRLPSDLANFKRLTLGQTIVIGRLTHESIGTALPGRRTIVVTRNMVPGMETAPTLQDAVARAQTAVFLAGGAAIYAEGMAFAQTLLITRVDLEPDGDTWFPPIDPALYRLEEARPGVRGERDPCDFSFETWRRTRRLD